MIKLFFVALAAGLFAAFISPEATAAQRPTCQAACTKTCALSTSKNWCMSTCVSKCEMRRG